MYDSFFRKELENLIPYEAGRPIEEVKAEFGLSEVIKLASNETPLPPFPSAIDAINAAAGELNRYPDGGAVELRKLLAAKYSVVIDNIAIGNGSNELQMLLGLACLNPGDEVVFPWPSFIVYPTIASVMGANGIKVPLNQNRNDVKALASAVTDKTKLLFTCSPNNPTGTVISQDEARWLMDNVPKTVLVAFDEAYIEFADDAEAANGLEFFMERQNVIIFRTFSKIYGLAGLRVGYCLATSDVIVALNKVRAPFNVNSLAQAAAIASLADKDEVIARQTLNQKGKEYMYAELDNLGLSYVPTQANFILIDTGQNSRQVFQELLKRGIIVRSGDIFGYDTWIRVTIGSFDENKKFFQGLREVIT